MLRRQTISRSLNVGHLGRLLIPFITGLLIQIQSTSLCAQPLQLELVVRRTERAKDCADQSKLRAKIERLRQHVGEAESLATETRSGTEDLPHLLQVSARFDKSGDEYLADVQFSGAKPGERRLSDRGRECASLEDAVAVAIVLLLDSENQHREPAPIVVPRAVPTIKISSRRIALRPAGIQSSEWLLVIKAGPIWATGDAPSIAMALDAGLLWRKRWQFELGAVFVAPKATSYGSGEVTVSMLAVEGRGCRLWGRSFFVGICAASTLGRLHGRGRGFDEGAAANLIWSAVGGSLLVHQELGRRWWGGLEASAWRPLSGTSFRVENAGSAWNSSEIWGGLAVRLGVRLP